MIAGHNKLLVPMQALQACY